MTPTAQPDSMIKDERETLEQYADRIVAATRKKMLDRLDDDVIGCLGDSHLIFGKACAMESVATAMNEMAEKIEQEKPTPSSADNALREALERLYHDIETMPFVNKGGALVRWQADAQGKIVAALSSPASEAEPVAWWLYEGPGSDPMFLRQRDRTWCAVGWTETPLYAAPVSPTPASVAGEVTNGAYEADDFGPIGDAARQIASYCEGEARENVYRAAKIALATPQPTETQRIVAWQPIETAPKDGTLIDLWVVFPSGGRRWADASWKEAAQHNCSGPANWTNSGGWPLHGLLEKPVATHWRQRPEAPASSQHLAGEGEKVCSACLGENKAQGEYRCLQCNGTGLAKDNAYIKQHHPLCSAQNGKPCDYDCARDYSPSTPSSKER